MQKRWLKQVFQPYSGLVTVYLNSQDAGNITVNFMTPMPDSTFNKLACIIAII